MHSDERRSARLLFDAELERGDISVSELDRRVVRRAVRHREVPAKPIRLREAIALKTDSRLYERTLLKRTLAARRAVLGEGGPGPPRLLVRMDEFPHARAHDLPERYGTHVFQRFHAIMAAAGVPYLLAVVPRPAHAYLDPAAEGDRPLADDERAALAGALRDGVEPAFHGLTHRTRHSDAGRHSELSGLSDAELSALIERAGAELSGAGLPVPRVAVPPFNRFEAKQWDVLAGSFDMVCGGPETVVNIGLHGTPLWRGDAVYVPSYPPLYGTAAQIEPALRRVIALEPGTWVPVTLHLGWEADRGWSALERLAEAMAPYARPWSELLEAAGRS